MRRAITPRSGLAAALLALLACLVVAIWGGRSAHSVGLPLAREQATPTVVIPGMPSCCCAPDAGPIPTVPAAIITSTPEPVLATFTPLPTAIVSSGEGKIVAIDPGHGGSETGAVAASGLIEKNANLRIALKLAALLRAGGYIPVLTRNSDTSVNTAGKDLNGNGVVNTDDDLQARVDIANAAHADILISIHNDGSTNTSARGTKVFYCDARPFAAQSIALAGDLQQHLIVSIRAAGYDTPNLGISDDAPLRKPYGHLFVLGPSTPRVARASSMPGALGETLFLTNPHEAALLASDSMLSAIAKGYYDGIVEYFTNK